VTEDDYGALLRHVYEFGGLAGSGKTSDPVSHREPHKKNRNDATGDLKNKGLVYLSSDLLYDLKGLSQIFFVRIVTCMIVY
jgi:hypothetical protein